MVFTDVQMPGTMDGLKLAKFIKDRWPPIKIVATSGRVKVTETDLPEGSVFVPKPYSPAQIISTLRALTDSALTWSSGVGGPVLGYFVSRNRYRIDTSRIPGWLSGGWIPRRG